MILPLRVWQKFRQCCSLEAACLVLQIEMIGIGCNGRSSGRVAQGRYRRARLRARTDNGRRTTPHIRPANIRRQRARYRKSGASTRLRRPLDHAGDGRARLPLLEPTAECQLRRWPRVAGGAFLPHGMKCRLHSRSIAACIFRAASQTA